MLRAFLFDVHNTLVRSKEWHELEVRQLPAAAFALLSTWGHIPPLDPASRAKTEAVFRMARQLAENVGLETSHVDDMRAMLEVLNLQHTLPVEELEKLIDTVHRLRLPSTQLVEGLPATLHRLRELGYSLGIISNAAYPPFIRSVLAHFEMDELFDEIVLSGDIGTRKPFPRIFTVALEKMRLLPGETVYVGDDFRNDVMGAKEIGMRAVLFRPRGDLAPEEDENMPDAIITALDQLPDLAERWVEEDSD